MPSHFTLCIIVLVTLAVLGLPIGLSMITASVFYLLVAGLDLGTAAEQILNGLFNSYVLLAVPLFILAADLMNSGSLTDRLLKFCLVLVGRFRGGRTSCRRNIIFAGMSGSAIADAVGIGRIIIGMMTKGRKISDRVCRGHHGIDAIIGPIIPPSIPMVVYASFRHVDRLSVSRWRHTGVAARRAFDHEHGDCPRSYPVEPPVPMREIRASPGLVPALAARRSALRHLWRGDDTHRGAAAAALYALLASTLIIARLLETAL
jgi:hypothetical protein